MININETLLLPENGEIIYVSNEKSGFLAIKKGEGYYKPFLSFGSGEYLQHVEYLEGNNRLVVVTVDNQIENTRIRIVDIKYLDQNYDSRCRGHLSRLGTGIYALETRQNGADTVKFYDLNKVSSVDVIGYLSSYCHMDWILNSFVPDKARVEIAKDSTEPYVDLALTYCNHEVVHIPLSLKPGTPYYAYPHVYSEHQGKVIELLEDPHPIELTAVLRAFANSSFTKTLAESCEAYQMAKAFKEEQIAQHLKLIVSKASQN